MAIDALTGPLFVDIDDVARLLGLSRSRIYQLVEDQRLPATRRGRRVLIPRAAFEAWLQLENARATMHLRATA